MPSGEVCRTWDDFLTVSAQRWAELRDELTSGRLAGYLAAIGRSDLAPRADAPGTPDERLDAWLGSLPTTRPSRPELDVHPRSIAVRVAAGRPDPADGPGHQRRLSAAAIDGPGRAGGRRLALGRGARSAGPFATVDETEVPVEVAAPETLKRPAVGDARDRRQRRLGPGRRDGRAALIAERRAAAGRRRAADVRPFEVGALLDALSRRLAGRSAVERLIGGAVARAGRSGRHRAGLRPVGGGDPAGPGGRLRSGRRGPRRDRQRSPGERPRRAGRRLRRGVRGAGAAAWRSPAARRSSRCWGPSWRRTSSRRACSGRPSGRPSAGRRCSPCRPGSRRRGPRHEARPRCDPRSGVLLIPTAAARGRPRRPGRRGDRRGPGIPARQQSRQGYWEYQFNQNHRLGMTALAGLAMLENGVALDDDAIRRAEGVRHRVRRSIRTRPTTSRWRSSSSPGSRRGAAARTTT